MANSWFRLYSEFADDPKVQMMPEAMQRRLVMLMCSKCKDETLQERQRAFHWRITPDELAETKALFLENGFIDEKWNPVNWNKRQFLSDSSTERVRRHRQGLKQDETLQTPNVTPPDTEQIQNRTEQKHKKPLAPSSPELHATAPPIGTLPCVGEPKTWHLFQAKVDEWQETYPGIDVKAELRKARQWLIDNPTDRKTFKGMPRFLNRWLAKEQNERGSNAKAGPDHQGAAIGRVKRTGSAWDAAINQRLAGTNGHHAQTDVSSLPASGVRPGDDRNLPADIRGSGSGVRPDEPRSGPAEVSESPTVLSPPRRSS